MTKEYAEKIILHQMVKNVINAIIKIMGFQDVKVNVVFHFIDKIQFYVKVYAKKASRKGYQTKQR